MSIGAKEWAYTWRCERASEKSVLNVIADRFNEDKRCAWPGIALLARDTGLSARTVKRAVRALASSGLVEVVPMYVRETKCRASNVYRLPFYRDEPFLNPMPGKWEP